MIDKIWMTSGLIALTCAISIKVTGYEAPVSIGRIQVIGTIAGLTLFVVLSFVKIWF
jgi:uncharacterized membrane protein YccC